MVLQKAPHSANVWGFLPACDDNVEVMFGEKMYTAKLNSGELYQPEIYQNVRLPEYISLARGAK